MNANELAALVFIVIPAFSKNIFYFKSITIYIHMENHRYTIFILNVNFIKVSKLCLNLDIKLHFMQLELCNDSYLNNKFFKSVGSVRCTRQKSIS